MNRCNICGAAGDPVWREGRSYCASCGSVMETAPMYAEPVMPTQPVIAQSTAVRPVCPICKNADNNGMRNGRYVCALCATEFDFRQPQYQQTYVQPSAYQDLTQLHSSARRGELEKKRNRKVVWGIVWIFLFWPIAVYQFYRAYQISQELSKL